MQELLGQLSQIGPFLEKLGVVGVLVFIVWYQYKENVRLREELIKVYGERDFARSSYQDCRGKNELLRQRLGLPVDVAALDLLPLGKA